MMRRNRNIFGLLCVALASSISGTAATITVADGAVAENTDGICSLIEAINEANIAGSSGGECATGDAGSDTIELAENAVYTFTAVYAAASALPVLNTPIVIEGNGSTLARSTDAATPEFRFIYGQFGVDLTLRNLTFANGHVSGEPGGALVVLGGPLLIDTVTFTGNTGAAGGAIYYLGGFSGDAGRQLTIADTVFLSNKAVTGGTSPANGGALQVKNGLASIERSIFRDNTADNGGGAIEAGNSGQLILQDATLSTNSANFGGGIAVSSIDVFGLNRVAVLDNEAKTTLGGGVSVFSTPTTFANVTIANNRAFGGGGVAIRGTTQLTVKNSTIISNAAAPAIGGGIVTQDSAAAILSNTILTDNTGAAGAPNCATNVTSGGHNIVGDISGCGFAESTGDIMGVSAGLLTLQNNVDVAGSGHFPLAQISPAIDSGDATVCVTEEQGPDLTVDQLQKARYGTCDIGAIEFGSCGDGFVQSAVEACDDGNADDTDGCLSSCVAATCGDGFVHAGVEACDDGNTDNADACSNSCATPACGDGIIQSGAGETCDDANTDNTDSCLNSCLVAFCGDGIVQAGVDACDDGNTTNGDGCEDNCTIGIVVDPVIEPVAEPVAEPTTETTTESNAETTDETVADSTVAAATSSSGGGCALIY